MGSGPYSEICFGVLDLGPLERHHEELAEILSGLGVHISSSYESSTKVFGITVLSTLHGHGNRDLSLGSCRVAELADVAKRAAESARSRYYDRREEAWKSTSDETYLQEAQQQWQELQRLAKEQHDLDVPDGELIWHEDYD